MHEFIVSSSAQSAWKCGLCDLVTALADHGLPNLNARAAQRVCVALGVGSALSVPSQERAGLTSSMFPSRHSARTLAGSDVALSYPPLHVALVTVTTLSGIGVKNSSDIVGKNVFCVSFV